MVDRIAEQGAVQYGQDRWSFQNSDPRLAGAGQIANEIRRLVEEGKYTDYVSGLSVKGRLINRMIDVVYWPRKLFANNELGAWYDPSDVNLTWRRNLLTYTEQFDNAVWSKQLGAIITPDVETALNGTLSLDRFDRGGTSTTSRVTQAPTVTSGFNYTLSIYAKAETATTLTVEASSINSWTTTTFNLLDGTASGQTGAYTVLVETGLYRCVLPFTAAGTGSQGTRIGSYGALTGTLLIGGAQLEVGASPTSYQRIVTPEITYVADVQPQPILWQDAAGTTPVIAIEQPVGLMLDKSANLEIGEELVTNGTFDTNTNGWTAENSGILSVDSQRLKVENGGAFLGRGEQLISTVIGKWYRVNYTLTAGTTTSNIRFGTAQNGSQYFTDDNTTAVAKVVVRYILATSTSLWVSLRTASSITGEFAYFDNISVKEIAGNHAYQSTTTARPVLRARYNLLTYSEQFDNAAWTKSNVTVTANATTAPDGTTTADKLVENTALSLHEIYQTVSRTINSSQTVSVYAKAAEKTKFRIYSTSASNPQALFDLTAVTATPESGSTASITSVGNGWFRCTATATALATSSPTVSIALVDSSGNTSYTGDGTSGIFIWGADARVTNDALNQPSYQRVGAGTAGTSSTAGTIDYDTVGFKPYLSFDGTDDFMVTNSIDFTGTDKMTVVAGVRKLSDAAAGVLTELSTNSTTTQATFGLVVPGGAFATDFWSSYGTTRVAFGNDSAAPQSIVYTGIANISAPLWRFRKNGATFRADSTNSQGTGNYGNYPLYIGRRGGTTLPYNGRLYGLIVRGAQSTDAEITNTETWMNNKTGAY